MAIKTRKLTAGMVLTVSYKGRDHTCTVVKNAQNPGGLGFVMDGGTEYKSLSGAGKSLHGSRAIGGFGFFTLQGENADGKTPATAKTAKKASKAAKPKTAKVPAVVQSIAEAASAVAPARRSHKAKVAK